MVKETQIIDQDAVNAAYALVVPSYDWTLRSLEAVEGRIQQLLTYITTITVGIPIAVIAIAGGGKSLDALSWSSYASFACFVLAMLVGLSSRRGSHDFLSVTKLQEDLELRDCEFKKIAFQNAGKAFDGNRKMIARKSCVAEFIPVLLIVEIGFWLWWSYRIFQA